MGKVLKKNWFVALICVIFAGMSIFYIYDTNKGKLKGKTANGEDVVYEVSGQDVTASSFYDSLYSTYGTNSVVALFEKTVADLTIKTTEDMESTAKYRAASIISNYSSNYGDGYEAYLKSDLASTGYTDLQEYLLTQMKLNTIASDYAKAHFDELKIRQVSYILVKHEDSSNPTEEPTEDEKARMDAVDAALASGTFADAAIAHSEDTSTASAGGVLGVIDVNSTSLDSAFLEAALALGEGEVSDWVYSESFGYFKIMVTACTQETLEANNTDTDPYAQLVSNYDTTLTGIAVWQKAQEYGVSYSNADELEQTIKDALGIEGNGE